MQKVGEDVKLGDLVEAFYSLILRLSADCIALKHAHIEVTAHDQCLKMLQCYCDRACPNKWIIDHVSWRDASLIRHQKCKLVVCRSRPEVRPLLEIVR